MKLVNKPARVVTQEVPTNMAQVLVAKTDIGLGQITGPENFRWQDWPQTALSPSYIQRSARPNAVTDLTGAVARTPMLPGEPITAMKLVKAGEGGVLAAILPAGMRAISTRIKEETGVGQADPAQRPCRRAPDHAQAGQRDHVAETLFRNVRVLAIGQLIEAKEGKKLAEGNTATLELTPQQAEELAGANARGRDLARSAQHRRHQGRGRERSDTQVKIMRYGAKSRVNGVVN